MLISASLASENVHNLEVYKNIQLHVAADKLSTAFFKLPLQGAG